MKALISGVLSLCLLASFSVPKVDAAEKEKAKLAEKSHSAILMEQDSGTVLYEKNSHEKLPPASMTKIMTLILIMEAIDKGKINWDDKIRVSEYAASMGGSQIFLEPGEQMRVEDMVKGIAIGSANDASVAMAEHIAGSADSFVSMMNDKAKKLGLKDTFFKNATGLPAAGHYTSAHDMAIMGKELLKHEEVTKFTGLYEDYLREDTDKKFWLVNTNRLVKFYPGVDGLKTGFTNEAKYCLTATANKNGMRVIAVVMGAPTPKERNAQITSMLDYAFTQFSTKKLFDRHEIVKEVKVQKSDKPKLPVVTSENISLLLKKGETAKKIKTEVTVDKDLKMPVKKGQQIGSLKIWNGKELITESPVLASETIKKASWWKLFKRTAGQMSKSS
ncbi:D-alanyl-D-alanine carboxypeptidase family protein [Fictibacillus phosphorivorans]|uniref:D-alanyl-D-alanine carboxypeptidase family protein n=1 Tax=Fictibacillus phosphorivorans TaxID=1221500 RepID=UPI00203AC0C1|nr:D-alanyl-D-alanine carboxypeptidase family protein [Fictibacillus phosphorivorans]MCM3719687.1 D-alanyl-D-alanine carboxypeptidase [Fictibacillus phosphorivorans]MCM3777378.1 D-alanyl-D-alanine carboxypeptidase [Fictibacillus phosphorivorans]